MDLRNPTERLPYREPAKKIRVIEINRWDTLEVRGNTIVLSVENYRLILPIEILDLEYTSPERVESRSRARREAREPKVRKPKVKAEAPPKPEKEPSRFNYIPLEIMRKEDKK